MNEQSDMSDVMDRSNKKGKDRDAQSVRLTVVDAVGTTKHAPSFGR